MFERIVYLAMFTLYSAMSAALLVFYDAGPLWVLVVLSLLPLVVLWRTVHLHTRLLPVIGVVAAALMLFIEVVAYLNGVWYELAPLGIRIFGLVPLGALIASFVHTIFLIVAYEYWFDDRTNVASTPPHVAPLIAFVGLVIALSVAYVQVFSGVFFSYPFAWLLFIVIALFAGAVLFVHAVPNTVLVKAACFSIAFFPVLLIHEWVMVVNELRFFANVNEYVAVIPLLGQSIPVEELALTLVVPFVVAVLYELYLDDRK